MTPATIAIGASIACTGICLTVVAPRGAEGGDCVFEVEAAPETLDVDHGLRHGTSARASISSAR